MVVRYCKIVENGLDVGISEGVLVVFEGMVSWVNHLRLISRRVGSLWDRSSERDEVDVLS